MLVTPARFERATVPLGGGATPIYTKGCALPCAKAVSNQANFSLKRATAQ